MVVRRLYVDAHIRGKILTQGQGTFANSLPHWFPGLKFRECRGIITAREYNFPICLYTIVRLWIRLHNQQRAYCQAQVSPNTRAALAEQIGTNAPNEGRKPRNKISHKGKRIKA